MRLIGNPVHSRHGSSHGGSQPQYQRLDWFELGNTWEPLPSSAKRYSLWKTAREIERLDTEVEKENRIMTETTAVQMVKCQSIYHKPRFEEVPQTAAYITRNGNWVCNNCKVLRTKYAAVQKTRKKAIRQAQIENPRALVRPVRASSEFIIDKLDIEPEIITDEVKPQWRVTLVVRTVTVVQASDFLDLAAQLEGKGEIVKVEKI